MPLAYIPSPPRSVWHVGPLSLRAQALCVLAAILLALWIADRRYRGAGGQPGVIADVAAWAVPAGLIPAAVGALLTQEHGGVWQAVRTWDAILGFPGAVAFGTLAAWFACRRLSAGRGPRPPRPAPGPRRLRSPRGFRRLRSPRGPRRLRSPRGQGSRRPARALLHPRPARDPRIRLGPVAGAVAPAIAFGQAVAAAGDWFSQQGYGHPSSLWWAVAISPAHRPSGYENFATFQPIFLYQAVWSVVTGVTVAWAARRFALPGERVFALWAAAYAVGGFALFWLGIGHLPVVLGLRAGELGDAAVLVGATVYLARTRRMRTKPFQSAQKPALERDSPVM
jgi:prolipoprotein diacylglyceryltransferase